MQRSRYGNTDLEHEYLIYPFKTPIKYDYNYTGTYSKYSLVDKYYVDNLVKPHKRLISGGAEWGSTGNGMTFSLSDIVYTFTGEILTFSASTPSLTFDNGSTSDRIDLIVINEDKTISIVKGEPNVTPTRPAISDSQIPIQYAYITANATTIGVSEAVYINNSQWQTQIYQLSGSLSGSVDLGSTNDQYLSSLCVDFNSDYKTGIKFTKSIGEITASQYGSLTMRIKLLSVLPEYKSLFAQIQGTASGSLVNGNTLNLMTYGLERSVINTWQHIVVPTSKLGSNVTNIKSLTLRMSGGVDNENTNWRADYIFFQKGYAFDGYMGEPDFTGGGGGGGASSTSGVIGAAEDGTYTDGVFTDFVPSTPIGTAIDRFNELFLSLVPSKATDLSNWSGARTGGVNGKLSFSSTQTISGSTYFGGDFAPTNPISHDGTWAFDSIKRLSIYAASSNVDITGVLNSQVGASSTGAFAALSFGDADLGTLTLNINGVIVSTASLTTLSAINNTSSSTISGFALSAATASKFITGSPFEQFKNRTGTWLVKNNDTRLRNGYNYLIAEHKFSTTTRTLARYELIIDDNTTNTTFSNFSITSYLLTGSKYLSGIGFFQGGTLYYDNQIDNLYRNTYYSGSDAITFVDNSTAGNAGTNPILNVSTQYTLPNSGGDEAKSILLSTEPTMGNGSPLAFSILASGVRRLNDPIGLYTSAKRTLQGTRQGGTASISNVYLDNVVATSTNTFEGFDDEARRLKTGTYDLITDVTSGTWDSTQSLKTGDPNHNTGLQVFGSSLIYPVTNYTLTGSLNTNKNFSISAADYSSSTGERTYYRYFYQASTTGVFKINIAGSGGTFVAKSTPLTGNNIYVEFKLPGSATPTTGWLDAYTDFASGFWTDGSGGRKANNGAGRAFGTDWGLMTGIRGTSTSGGYIIVRIRVAQGSTAIFTGLTFTFM